MSGDVWSGAGIALLGVLLGSGLSGGLHGLTSTVASAIRSRKRVSVPSRGVQLEDSAPPDPRDYQHLDYEAEVKKQSTYDALCEQMQKQGYTGLRAPWMHAGDLESGT